MKSLNTIAIFMFGAMLTASCQTQPATNTAKPAANSSPAVNSTGNGSSEKPASPPVNAAAAVTDDLSTPTSTYKTAYAARKNKDTNALRRLIADDMMEFLEIIGEGEPNPVEEGLKQLVEAPQGSSNEVRNEKITGDKATLQYLDKDDKWKTLDFIKEDGGWKITIARPGPDDVKVTRN